MVLTNLGVAVAGKWHAVQTKAEESELHKEKEKQNF